MYPVHSKLIAALSLSLLAGSAHAVTDYAFQIDSFWVFKNVSSSALETPDTLAAVTPFFMDDFNNGALPGLPTDLHYFSNGTPATYSVTGTTGPEQFGKLSLSLGGMVDNGFGTKRTNVTLNTNTNSDPTSPDATKGLKSWNDNFFAIGVWDLSNPGNSNGSYGVRFNDSFAGVPGNDIVSLAVRGRTDGQAVVSFLHFNNTDGTSDLLESHVLDTSHDQIGLGLGYLDTDGNGSKEVGAAYFYLDGGLASGFNYMGTTTQIFHGENWTRATFFASDSAPVPVPEPSDYAMMLAGLGLISLVVRRRQV